MTRSAPTRIRLRTYGNGARPPAPPLVAGGNQRWGLLAVAGGIFLVLAFVWTMLVGNYDQYGAVIVAMVLLVISVPVARHAARVEGWPALAGIMMAASILRIAGGWARYTVAYGVYSGVADASTYTTVAQKNYKAFRHFHLFWPNTGVFHGFIPWLDTIIYALAGPTELGAFFIFSWISFIGAYLFYRAFRIGYPDGDGRRYAVLVLFLPSMLYWPSSLGKEAWMVFAIGLACYGLARALTGRVGGYVALMAGIGGMLLIRPHLALIFLPAAVVAFLLRRTAPGAKKRPLGRLLGIVILAVSSLVVVAKAQSYFGITNLDVQSVTQELNTTRQSTAIGQSAFHPPNAQSPLGFPQAVVTVLFRPFPFEAHSATVLVASLEGVTLIGLTIGSWPRLRRLPRALWRNPYLVFALLYSALFILAFSNFANYGILARERVQMLPLFLVLLAIAPRDPVEKAAVATSARIRSRPPARTAAVPARRSGSPVKLRPYGTPPARPTAKWASRPASIVPPAPPLLAGSYRALDFSFAVEVVAVDPEPLRERITEAFGDLAGSPSDANVYRLTETPLGDRELVVIERDGVIIGGPTLPASALVHLMSDINGLAITSRPDQLILHAAALSLDGRGVLLPGPPGSGKSTLAGALVAAGFDYLTDEAAAIDTETLEVAPYPKPLSLSAPVARLLGVHAGLQEAEMGEALMPSSALRANSGGRRVPARLLLFPTYVAAGETELVSMTRAEAFVEVTNNSFNFVNHGGEWMGLLRRLVTQCTCARLMTNDLDRAAKLIRHLLAPQGGSGP